MHRWISFLGALMLVLTLWTGGAAHAAERFDCIPATAEAGAHYEGDQDQAPSSPSQGVAHHHSGCSGHHLAAPVKTVEAAIGRSVATRSFPRNETGPPSREPDNELRPPIA